MGRKQKKQKEDPKPKPARITKTRNRKGKRQKIKTISLMEESRRSAQREARRLDQAGYCDKRDGRLRKLRRAEEHHRAVDNYSSAESIRSIRQGLHANLNPHQWRDR